MSKNFQAQQWEVQKIIQRGNQKGITKYLVQWKGFPPGDATWEPITNLQNCQEAIIEFEKQNREKANHRKSRKTLKGKEGPQRIRPPSVQPQASTSKIQQRQDDLTKKNSPSPLKKIEKHKETKPLVITQEEIKQALTDNSLNTHATIKQEANYQQQRVEEGLQRNKRKMLGVTGDEQSLSKKIKLDEMQVAPLLKSNPQKNHVVSNCPSVIKQSSNNDLDQKNPEGVLKNKPETIFTIQAQECSQKCSQKTGNTKDHKIDNIQLKINLKDTNPKEGCPSIPSKTQQDIKEPCNKPDIINNLVEKKLKTANCRYQFCDIQFQNYQKTMLTNIVRKCYGKSRIKPFINMIDLSNKTKLLEIVPGIQIMDEESALDSLEMLAKVNYGWMAIGKRQNQCIIIDVKMIKEDNWKLLVDIITQKQQKE